jgi:Spy/CpxP family protein refolding chaperone
MKLALPVLRRPRASASAFPSALLLAAVLTAPLAATVAQAQTTASTAGAVAAAPASRHGAWLQKMLQSIGASAAQQTQIESILAQARSDIRQQTQAGGNPHRQLAQALAAASIDATAAETARQQIVAQHDSASQRMLQAQLQVAAVLTPAQRQQWLALSQQQRGRWQGQGQGQGQGQM